MPMVSYARLLINRGRVPMISSLPKPVTARERYVERLQSFVDAAASGARFDSLPWSLLALNAIFYLDSYLPPREYQMALAAALQAAEREIPVAATWVGDMSVVPTSAPREAAVRPLLYRSAFDQAARHEGVLSLLLAQHGCEIAEVLPLAAIGSALNLFASLASTGTVSSKEGPVDLSLPPDAALEELCRSLLTSRIAPDRFETALLLIHAGKRAFELVDPGYTTAYEVALQRIGPLPLTSRSLKRIRFVQPVDLARRAVALRQSQAVLVVEAGLVEAESLGGAAALLMLAALDRALAVRERRAARSNGS